MWEFYPFKRINGSWVHSRADCNSNIRPKSIANYLWIVGVAPVTLATSWRETLSCINESAMLLYIRHVAALRISRSTHFAVSVWVFWRTLCQVSLVDTVRWRRASMTSRPFLARLWGQRLTPRCMGGATILTVRETNFHPHILASRVQKSLR